MRRAFASSRGMDLWRPCDTVESAVAWAAALERHHGPSCLLFTRQNCPFVPRALPVIDAIARGGYVLADFDANVAGARAVILATGSEVALALGARDALAKEGVERSRRVDAVHERVRASGRRLPGVGIARGHSARRGRGRRDRLLASLRRRHRRSARRGGRHRHLRRVGAGAACCSSISGLRWSASSRR